VGMAGGRCGLEIGFVWHNYAQSRDLLV